MKATGIVRRIDDLGRVVIPKEIRRTQMIRVGDPLEIFVSGEGEVVFKKYSPIGELSQIATEYAETLYKVAGLHVAVADRDAVVAAVGSARVCMGRRLSEVYTQAVAARRPYDAQEDGGPIRLCDSEPLTALHMVPILCQGDLIGSVAITGGEKPFTGIEPLQAKIAATFFGRRLEE